MSSKMNQIPFLSSYEDVRAEMNRDLQYRLNSRTAQTSLGRPLYYRINVQMITTQECPFHWSHSKLNAEKSLTLFSALFFYLFQGLKWEKRGDEW